MRYKSQSRMEEILRFIDRYILENQKSPSIQNIADEIGIAKSLAYKYLLEMREKGMIEYDGTTIRTSVTKKANFTTQMAPILGSIVCGQPEYAEENFEEYVSLPTAIFGFGDFFVLRAWGKSMIFLPDGVQRSMYIISPMPTVWSIPCAMQGRILRVCAS